MPRTSTRTIVVSIASALAVFGLGACGVSESPAPESTPSGGHPGGTTGAGAGAAGAGGAAAGGAAGAPSQGEPFGTGGGPGAVDGNAGAAATDGGAPPAVGARVDAGPARPGTDPVSAGVPADRIVVFLHFGHSNMAGRATAPAELRGIYYDVDPRLWSYHFMNMVTGKGMPFLWRPAKEPLSPDDMTSGRAGPGMALLKTALAGAAPGYQFVSIGHGHSGTEGGHCRNYRRTGLLYPIVMGPAKALKGKVTFGGIFVMLGTTERYFDSTVQMAFGDCLKGVAADIREDLGDPNIPFMVSDWEGRMGDKDPTSPAGLIIIPQLKAAPTNITRCGFIPQDSTFTYTDMNHYDMAGYKKWAERGVALLKEKAWAPWAAK